MKKIGEFKKLSDLVSFVRILQREFTLTNFAAVLPLLQPAYYNYAVDLQYSDEGSYGARSDLRVKIEGGASWGAQSPAEFSCDYLIEWNTTSGHIVRIEGKLTDGHTGKGEFQVYRGNDESETFYPIVEEVLQGVAK